MSTRVDPVFTPIPLLTIESSMIKCPHCGKDGPTIIDHKTGVITYLSCITIAALGFLFGCCLIPFCVNSLKDVVHKCSSCRQVVATYERL